MVNRRVKNSPRSIPIMRIASNLEPERIMYGIRSNLQPLGDPVGARDTCPLVGLNLFIFMQFLGKIGQNNRLAPPHLGKPGSAINGRTCFCLGRCNFTSRGDIFSQLNF